VIVLLLGVLLVAQPAPVQEPESQAAADAMNQARRTFEYGVYAQASKMLAALLEAGRFESLQSRAEAYRLLGLSLFYQGRKGDSYSAFLEYLYLDPDAELDPFYVPPNAVQFFDEVKKEAEPRLAPIRAQKRAEQEAQKKAAAEEAEKRRRRELEEERKRLAVLSPRIERRVVEHEFWVTMMPFGIGQLQNGDRTLGITLATGQLISGAASAGSALLIEGLRDNDTGKFNPNGSGNAYQNAQRLDVIKWVGAAVFFALWAGGAVHAAINYKPEEVLPDRLLQPGQVP
jgi:pyruvate/2-oxoglutarate dehydrogenase complex dihydrolipoamide acyltransferase (E2) component